ncbi:hypothetical protein [Bergeyella sp. RCAD1439]|uniref:hypothetical protein n=1 Tax=Bergeyella anatis TaxID=3113737 RepID=UPI002E182EF8|nr:hypothetical protein [Bergeyella sp. RCAD1439]
MATRDFDFSMVADWQDYWRLFDDFISGLKADGKEEVALELKETRNRVNGMTDGWHEFKLALAEGIASNRGRLTERQMRFADFLLEVLAESLSRR